MRTIVHLSDLHFGRIDQAIIEPLAETVTEIKPDVVVVSGDLTQRARAEQFQEAREFLDELPHPQIIVPGNHDVPLYNIFQRFLEPLDKYRRYITDDLEPFFADDEIALLGINTARSLTIKDGRVNEQQVARIRERLCHYGDAMTKFIVTHHPFDIPEGHEREADLVGARADGDGGSGDVRRGRVALRPPARQPHGTHGQAL
jgi:3',5'-cyclic AMP phosphodiesterase CpdA